MKQKYTSQSYISSIEQLHGFPPGESMLPHRCFLFDVISRDLNLLTCALRCWVLCYGGPVVLQMFRVENNQLLDYILTIRAEILDYVQIFAFWTQRLWRVIKIPCKILGKRNILALYDLGKKYETMPTLHFVIAKITGCYFIYPI
jgi:hypothetical protein